MVNMLCHVLRGKIKCFSPASCLIFKVHCRVIKKFPKMYGHSGYGGFFGNSVQGMGPMPSHPNVLNNPRVNRNYFMDSGGVNIHCPMRKVLCGELRLHDAGHPVEICGRLQNQRLGRFLSLRDDTGITQLVVPDDRIDIQKRLRNMPLNSFLVLRGFVTARPDKSRNEKMATGDVEVLIENLLTVHPKRKKDDSDTDDEDVKRHKKKASINSASLKLTSEELSKCPTPALIKHFSQRSHTCGELSKRLVGQNITLCGWVSAKRVGRFVMLKDGYGSVQIVPEIQVILMKIDNESTEKISLTKVNKVRGFQNVALTNKFQNLHIDSILVVKGIVSRRPPGHENPRVENGNIEVLVESLVVVNPHDPVSINDEKAEGGSGSDSGEKAFQVPPAPEENEENFEKVIADPNKYSSRTHTCGELSVANVGQKVRLVGWIEFSRLNKFILLRDRYGRTQLIIPDTSSDLQNMVKELTLETVVMAEGTVCSRPPGQENAKQITGSIEVSVTDLKVLGKAKDNLPIYVRDFNKATEPLRMTYRYIDLRNENMQKNLRFRSTVVHKMRRFLVEHLDFLEVDTPTLFKRTPGGAQEFVVPTEREGKFYSLVQSPQQFKQLLMVGSVDRYFQFAHCYRDEAIQSDRQPEFVQLDLEMSFCDRESILNLIEDLLKYCWPETLPPLVTPFPRITYEEAMNSYGTDKPDLRFEWKFEDLTELFKDQRDNCEGKIDVKTLLETEDFSAHAFVGRQGAPKFSNATKSNLLDPMKTRYPSVNCYSFAVKALDSTSELLGSLFCRPVAEEIEKVVNLKADDVLFLAFGPKEEVLEYLGEIRVKFANYLEEKKVEIINKNAFKFLWVLDFPLFCKNGEEISACHHPFTQPHPDDRHLLETEPLKVKSLHYDLVLNGSEIGGGSIRIHDSELQELILKKILHIDPTPMSHLLNALESGAPPHGGIALGLDRLFSVLCGTQTMRDVIAFPKGHWGQDLMAGAPCDISEEEKKRYHIRTKS